jgi:beta-glucosidase
VDVTNNGRRAGMDVVQRYVRQPYASVEPPVRRLRDFQKIRLEPGQLRTVTFRLPGARLRFMGCNKRMVVERGELPLQVRGLTARLVVES